MLGAARAGEGEGLVGAQAPPLEGGLDPLAQGRAQGPERHQPGSGPWPSRNLRQSAGRFSWKEAIPSLGSGP